MGVIYSVVVAVERAFKLTEFRSRRLSPYVPQSRALERLVRLLVLRPAAAWATFVVNRQSYRAKWRSWRVRRAVRQALEKIELPTDPG